MAQSPNAQQEISILVVSGGDDCKCPKFIPVDHCNAVDKLLDYVPNLLDKISEVCKEKGPTYSYKFYKDGEEKENAKQEQNS